MRSPHYGQLDRRFARDVIYGPVGKFFPRGGASARKLISLRDSCGKPWVTVDASAPNKRQPSSRQTTRKLKRKKMEGRIGRL
ncbi:Hypothetical protein NTJ_10303 [Nesidiocoris tenuis]|uniref:F5/8 type C domain-containing protein n=1 Tax=Nesidiocoris tenuis TaxID=355587 RepID=A0ABN7B128_9HEMI|nr:Hypothetical protein NTJ_10303 [Nesidiocoris tenuis]